MIKLIKQIIIALTISLCGANFALAVSIEDLAPIESTKFEDIKDYQDAQAVSKLPNLTIEEGISGVIRTVLRWSMIMTIAALIVAAGYYLIAQGKEDDIGKAKDIIVYLIIGIAIMGGAYGIVTGIAQFKFFE